MKCYMTLTTAHIHVVLSCLIFILKLKFSHGVRLLSGYSVELRIKRSGVQISVIPDCVIEQDILRHGAKELMIWTSMHKTSKQAGINLFVILSLTKV